LHLFKHGDELGNGAMIRQVASVDEYVAIWDQGSGDAVVSIGYADDAECVRIEDVTA